MKKRKVNFEEICWIKNGLSLSSYTTPPWPQTGYQSASYLSLIYIRGTALAIHEETIFVDASGGRLPIYI